MNSKEKASGIVIIKWFTIGEKAIQKFKRKEERLKKRKFYRKYQYSDLASYKEIVNSGRIRYKSFTDASRFYFDNCSLRLGYMQKKLFNELIVSILKKLFGDDLIANLKFLSNKFAIEKLCNAVAILFPRRSGKTEGCALFIAILAVSQPDWNSTMYNLTLKQAREFLHTSIKHLLVFQSDATFGWKLTKRDDKQMIEIKTNKYGTKNSVKSYPCALKDGKIGQKKMDKSFLYHKQCSFPLLFKELSSKLRVGKGENSLYTYTLVSFRLLHSFILSLYTMN